MNLTKRNLIAFVYYKSERRREKRREAQRRKRRCPPAPPPSPASPPPPSPASPPTPPARRSKKRKTAIIRAYAFNSSDSDYSPNTDSNKSDSDFSTPRKRTRKRTKLFSEDDEIKILKGLLYMNKHDKKMGVTDEVAEHINSSLRGNVDFSKAQFRRKIRGMKDKYNKNRDKEGKFYKLCAKIWGDHKEEPPINSSPTRVLFENDSNVHDSCAADTDVVHFADESYLDNLYVEDSYAEDSENNDELHNEEGNDSIDRRTAITRKFKELDIMTLQLFLKRLDLMKETIGAVLEVIQ